MTSHSIRPRIAGLELYSNPEILYVFLMGVKMPSNVILTRDSCTFLVKPSRF